MTTLVYKYGLLAPTSEGARARAQIRAAHNYGNTLTRIERERRLAVRAVMSAHGEIPVLEVAARAADDEVGRLVNEAKRAKSEARSHALPASSRAAIKAARDVKREAGRLLREARVAAREDTVMQAALDDIADRAGFLVRSARTHCGVYWGTYQLVEAAAEASRKMPLYDGAEPNDPRFSRWDGEGRVGVQVQGGADVEILSKAVDTRIRIIPAPLGGGADPQSKRSAKSRRAVLMMRVGSEGRSPIFAQWPMIMHRPLPPGARIKCASVSLQRIGPREEWSVSITLDTTACANPRPAPNDRVVGIDLGWRRVGDVVRICAWDASDERGTLTLPQSIIDSQRKAHELRGIRDANFNAARTELLASVVGIECPDWLTRDLRTLAQWRSADRLARLARHWRTHRFDGDATTYEALEAWRYHDQHIYTWESSQRASVLRHRREIFRVFAADMARRFGACALEAEKRGVPTRELRTPSAQAEPLLDLVQFAERRAVEDEEAKDGPLRAWRTLFAPSEFRLCLVNAFTPSRVRKIDAAGTTQECADCGHRDTTWPDPAALMHVCGGCGREWDRDENAARNIRARGVASGGDGSQNTEGAREEKDGSKHEEMAESRWVRAARMKREKDARRGGARN